MSLLSDLVDALATGAVEVVDLTAPLSRRPRRSSSCPSSSARPRGSSWRRSAGTTTAARPGTGTTSAPASTPAPTSTRRTTGSPGEDSDDVASVPARRLVAPAAVLDFSDAGRRRPRLPAGGRPHQRRGRPSTGRSPPAAGCSTAPAGTRARTTRRRSSTPTRPARTPPASRPSARAGWPRSRRSIGVGVETVGTDAGAAHSFDPPFPCHSFLLGAGKYGLTQLQNLARLPPTGAVVDRRAAADRRRLGQPRPGCWRSSSDDGRRTVARGGRPDPRRPGVDQVFGVVGSGNFHVTNAWSRRARVRRRPARGRRGDDGRRLRAA